jgi:hypothetical protein
VVFKRPKLKRVLFLHIQKTAGSSIVDLARLKYGSDEVASHGDYLTECIDHSLKKVGAAAKRPSSGFENKLFISGHFGYDFARPFLEGRYSFTFLRDPIERILSYYYFCKTRDPKEFEVYALTQELTLERFLALGLERPVVKACIWNNQAWQLANGYGHSNGRYITSYTPEEILELAIRHLDDFSYIGFTETFKKDRDHILKAIGISPPKANIVSNSNPGRLTARDLPTSTLKLLEELTHLDRELYNVAWGRRKLLPEEPSLPENDIKENYIKRWLRKYGLISPESRPA